MSAIPAQTPVVKPRRPEYRWIRRLLTVLAIVLLAVAAGVSWTYWIARRALPQLDGTVSATGLRSVVTVTRDAHGVPTIEAQSLDDLFYAQGYVTAQDRLWQMDVIRRFAGGEISEILGPQFVQHDREQRILGLRAAAHHALEALSARDRSWFEAYARGINAYMESRRERLPIEFRILRYTPRPWTVEDSFVMGARLVQDLNHGIYENTLQREKILAKLGPELTADLYVNSSWRDRPPTGKPVRMEPDDEREGAPGPVADGSPTTAVASAALGAAGHIRSLPDPEFAPDAALVPGSNNWVISGAHTVTGKPLLSNDMHLGHQMPNLWYEAHLQAGDYDVTGVTLPGLPFVIVGHNRRVAWGFTNVEPTVEDIYVEQFNEAGQYRTPQGWIEPQHREEVIHVKGQPDVKLDVVITRHGPLISELVPGERRKLALRWMLYEGLHDPFFDINASQNWQEFRKALSAWDSPSQNAVYADVDGHIGYQTTGKIPIRAQGDGALPEDGASDDHEWTGYIPFDKLPSAYDPPSGILATANGRITPDGYPYAMSSNWGSPWRTERIYRILESGKKFTAEDMIGIQTDVFSAFDRLCAERLVYALDQAHTLSPRAAEARELMRDWDGRLSMDSAAATVENRARYELMRLLLEPKLGTAPKPAEHGEPESGALSWKEYRPFMSSVWLEGVLLKQPKRWLPEKYSSYDALLAAAVESAVANPQAPRDLSQWRWGTFAPVVIEHPILSRVPLLGRWSGPGTREQTGGSYTVKQVGRGFGPSERMTVDLSELDRTTLNTVTGQGGNVLSPYYMDQWQAWYEGFSYPLPFSPGAVEAGKAHRLVLQPAR